MTVSTLVLLLYTSGLALFWAVGLGGAGTTEERIRMRGMGADKIEQHRVDPEA